jgi:hypothetical protein
MQKLFVECEEWLDYPQHQSKFQESRALLQEYVGSSDELRTKEMNRIDWLAHHSGMAACLAYGRQHIPALSSNLRDSVGYRGLALRLGAMFSAKTADEVGGRPTAFRDSLRAAGPAMLGWWEEAEICAKGFIEMAEKDQRLRIPESRRLRRGSVDAFLIGLMSQAFSIETVFQSLNPIPPVYADLLLYWNSEDSLQFMKSMQAAMEFHISRSRESTDKVSYEFDDYFNRIFPVELLVVQALRKRDHLPEFDVGHVWVDNIWLTIKQLPNVPSDPLLPALEARLQNEFPLFRQYAKGN